LGKTRKEIKEHIMSKQVQVTKNDIVEGWSLEAGDFINKVNIIYKASYYKESLRIDLASEEPKKSKTMFGSRISLGKTCMKSVSIRFSCLR
jgi:hypothetical protein